MRKRSIILIGLVVMNLLGCQNPQNNECQPTIPVSKGHARTVSADFAQLPDTVESVLNKLGVTLDDRIEETGRCTYVGTSLSEHTVKVETAALVTGESVVHVIVIGERNVGRLLQLKVDSELRTALLLIRRTRR